MNKLKILLGVLFLFGSIQIFAQYNFVVQNGTAKVFKTIDEAYNEASPGDTIYIPGGSFNMPSNMEKGIVWIGVGYHPDSTTATYYSRINNGVVFSGNSDSTQLIGLHFNSNVSFNSVAENVAKDVLIHRCRIIGSLALKTNDNNEYLLNSVVSECIIDGNIEGNYGSNIIVKNTIVRGILNRFVSSYLDQCIFTSGARNYSWGQSYTFTNFLNCQIRNSVIVKHSYDNYRISDYTNTNNNFLNNIFTGTITFPDGTNSGSGNLTQVDPAAVFEFIDGAIATFSYAHDFHLKEGSPAIGAGANGYDIGIYSGMTPFKEGGLPFTPHIRSVEIDNETTDGKIQVKIGVAAQNN